MSQIYFFGVTLYMFWTVFPSKTCSVLLQKNKYETLMHLVGFTIEIYYDARPYERQKWKPYSGIY